MCNFFIQYFNYIYCYQSPSAKVILKILRLLAFFGNEAGDPSGSKPKGLLIWVAPSVIVLTG